MVTCDETLENVTTNEVNIIYTRWGDKWPLRYNGTTPLPKNTPILLSWSLHIFWLDFGGNLVRQNILVKLTKFGPIFTCQLHKKQLEGLVWGSRCDICVAVCDWKRPNLY